MKRILVIFTGGTIGSKMGKSGVDVASEGSYALLESYAASPQMRADVQLEAIQPLNVLSENMLHSDWQVLARTISEALREGENPDPVQGSVPAAVASEQKYAGIIVTHGSDTLAFSTIAMSYLFAGASLPIVMTAGNYPLEDERSNGLRNFAASIDLVADEGLRGVYAVFENDRGQMEVMLGGRITQAVSFTDQFGSLYQVPAGYIQERQLVWNNHPSNPSLEACQQQGAGKIAEQLALRLKDGGSGQDIQWSSHIQYLRPYPCLRYDTIAFGEHKPHAILHDLYHSGTAAALQDGPYSLPAFVHRCANEGIAVYVCPFRSVSEVRYASALQLLEAGVLPLEGQTVEAALVKLMLAYGMYEQGLLQSIMGVEVGHATAPHRSVSTAQQKMDIHRQIYTLISEASFSTEVAKADLL